MGQTPTPTKPATTPEPTQEVVEEEGEPANNPKPELEPVPIQKESKSPQTTTFDHMAATARHILAENPDIAQRMLEHLKSQPRVPLRPEELVSLAKPVEDQP